MTTKATLYSSVFWTESVLLLEVELSSLQIVVQYNPIEKQNSCLRMEELDILDEIRLQAQQNLKIYQARMFRAFDHLVHPWIFQVGELVLVLRRQIIPHKENWWEIQAHLGRSLCDGEDMKEEPINSSVWMAWDQYHRSTKDIQINITHNCICIQKNSIYFIVIRCI